LIEAGPPPETLRAKLEHAQQTDQRRVYLQGRQLATDPRLPALLSFNPQAVQFALVEDGPGLELPTRAAWLRKMGITRVYLSLPSAAADARPLRESLKPTLALLVSLSRDRDVKIGMHVSLSRRAASEVPAVLRLQARLGIGELLISEPLGEDIDEQTLDEAASLNALERIWLSANAQDVRLRVIGFERTRYRAARVGSPSPSCDRGLRDIIRQGIPLALSASGIRLGAWNRIAAPT
jgi:hypothetical protein